MKTRYALCAGLALLLLLSACAREAAGPEPPTPSPSPAPTPELTPEPTPAPTIWGEQALRTTFVDGDGVVYFNVDISLPYAAAPGYEAVNAYFGQMLLDYAAQIQEQAALISEGSYTPEYARNFDLYVRGGVRCQGERFLSMGVYEEGFTGGAHPYHYSSSACFDLSTGGQLVSLDQLFTDWPAARALILAKIRSQLKDRLPDDNASLEYAPEAADKRLEDTPFYLTEDGLEIFYNEYALAAYRYGSFDFIIPYESLEDLLIP